MRLSENSPKGHARRGSGACIKAAALIVAGCLLLPILVSASSAQAATSASLPSSSEGATIAVPLAVDSDGRAFAAMELKIGFDPAIVALTDVVPAATLHDCTLAWNVTGDGAAELDVAITCASRRAIAGPVAYLFFDGVVAGGSSALPWLAASLDDVPIALTLGGSVSVASATSTLRMESLAAESGSTVDLELAGELEPGSIGINAEVHWDPAVLSGVSAALAPGLPSDCFLSSFFPAPGEVRIAVSCVTPLSGPTSLAYVTVDVVGPPGSTSPLDLVSGSVNEVDAALEDGIFSAVGGSVVAVPPKSFVCSGAEVVVPISVSPADGVIGMDFELAYDDSLVLPVAVTAGDLAAGCTLDWAITVPGELLISSFCVIPLTGSGVVANAVFEAVGPGPATSALSWLRHDLNEGGIASTSSDGEICVTTSESSLSLPEDVGGTAGALATVPLNGEMPPGSIAVNAVVNWDPAVLTALTLSPAAGLPGWLLDYDIGTPGTASISLFGTTPVSGSVALVDIEFSVIGTVGDSSTLDLSFGQINEVPACLLDGTFYACNDCNDDNPCTSDVCVMGSCSNENLPATAECRPAAGLCDVAETCDGAGTCPADEILTPTTQCRASAGICDVMESCTGTSAACPSDEFLPPATECRASAGPCDATETCTGATADCPENELLPATTACRAAAGDCDAVESCSGVGVTCPADELLPSTTICRSSRGLCDLAESCSGVDSACPVDTFVPATTLCRAANGPCDVSESCSGAEPGCPDDAFLPATTECRAAAGPCDAVESCTGAGAACPADELLPATTACRASAGLCDLVESCSGTDITCPADEFSPATTVCRASAGDCDVAESCTGADAVCPNDAFEPDDTPCDDDDECTEDDVCSSGVCAGDPQTVILDPIDESVRADQTIGTTTFAWSDPPGSYNAYRGVLLVTDVWAYNQTCFAQGLAAPSFDDSQDPVANEFFYYLITRIDDCGNESTPGEDSSGQSRPNSSPCP